MSRQIRPAPFTSRLAPDDPRREADEVPTVDLRPPRAEPPAGWPETVIPEGQYRAPGGRRYRVVRATSALRGTSVRWYTRGGTGVIRDDGTFEPSRDTPRDLAEEAESFFRSHLGR